MYERIRKLYLDGRLTEIGVGNAVKRGWITAEQYKDITGEDYAE